MRRNSCGRGCCGPGFAMRRAKKPADLCVVNTCTVTVEGDAKSRQTIRQLAKRNPQARIVVMGCYATRAPAEVARLPGVVEVVTDKRELPDLLGRFGVDRYSHRHFDVRQPAAGVCQSARRLPAAMQLLHHSANSAAFRQPAAGAYCRRSSAARGRWISRNRADRDSSRALWRRTESRAAEAANGCGWRIWSSGLCMAAKSPRCKGDRHILLPGHRKMSQSPIFALRLSSIEATEVTRELLAVMAAWPERVCPHLHVSMQSGSESVLRRMRRRWGPRRFLDRCLLAQTMLDLPALDDRHHRRLSRRNRGRFSSDLRFGPRSRVLEDSHFPVQRPARHRGRDDAGASAAASEGRALPAFGGVGNRIARSIFPANSSAGDCKCWSNRRCPTGRAR